jgi:hypothetical protein
MKKKKLILNFKNPEERQKQIKEISDEISRALKEGVKESNEKIAQIKKAEEDSIQS